MKGSVAARSKTWQFLQRRGFISDNPDIAKKNLLYRGDEIYESQARQQVEEGNHGNIVAIDIETGAFEVANDIVTASDHLLSKYPDAQTWFIRIGHRAVYHFGARSLRETL